MKTIEPKEPIFYDKTGFLTSYGFACGYTERRETDLISLQLWQEHNTFHCRYYNYVNGERIWNSFDKLGEAKKDFFALCDKLNLKRIKYKF